jgi:hypothetical protein
MFKIKCKKGQTFKGHLLQDNMIVADVAETFYKIKDQAEDAIIEALEAAGCVIEQISVKADKKPVEVKIERPEVKKAYVKKSEPIKKGDD